MVDKTTIDERLLIGDIMQDPFVKVEKACDLLYTVWEEFFSMREQKPIDKYDAERIGTALWFVNEALFDALTDYELRISEVHSDRVRLYIERAKAYELALQVNKAHSEAVNVAWKIVPDEIRAAKNLPDEDALPKLQEIINRFKGVTA